jgi:putative DNA primase/helicase
MSDFATFARACGLDITNIAHFDKIVRCPTFNKPHKKNGAYMVRRDGNGWVIAYDQGGELQWFDDPAGPKKWTEEEKRAWARQKAEHEAELRRKHQRGARDAAAAIAAARLGNHGYLHRKGFPQAQGLVEPDGALFIPMRHLTTGSLLGGQRIRWLVQEREWEKKYLFGTDPRQAVLRMGPHGNVTTILCEGYATGLSIAAAVDMLHLRAAVMVCFNDSNIVRVAEALANAPFHRCVFADHDAIPPAERVKRDRGEPYETRGPGELAAVKTGLPYAMAPGLGDDANDFHQREGVMALCALLLPVVRG